MKTGRLAILLSIVAVLLLTGRALALSSTNYRLDWFTPLTGGGGAKATSANYAVNLTIGQSAIGNAGSTTQALCLGYWCGAAVEYRLYLPLVLRNQS